MVSKDSATSDNQVVSMPLTGKYIEEVRDSVSGYVGQSDYNDEFDRLGDSLERIEEALTNDK